MFERASKKLGLEHAVLGSRQFDAEEYEENQRNSAKMDAKELEQLLREGAYSVLLEDNNEELKTFCEQDIESILDQRTHVIREDKTESALAQKQKHRARKSIFTGESATQFAEVDVNDPDFWKKVLPDLVTPDTMLQRLGDADLGAEEDEEEEAFVVRQGTVKKYMNDVSRMMEGILDLQRRGQLPERERGVCMKLLLHMTLKEEVFDYHQRAAAQEWLTVLEGTRNRRRQDVDKYQPLPIVTQVDTKQSKRLKGAKGAVKGGVGSRKRKRGEEDDADSDEFVADEEEDKPGKRGGKKGAGKKDKGEASPGKLAPGKEGKEGVVRRRRRPRSDIGTTRAKKYAYVLHTPYL